jgi:hypothetical protein
MKTRWSTCSRYCLPIIAVTLVAMPMPALSESDTTTAAVTARIADSVGVSEAADMTFNWLAQPTSPGTTRLDPSSSVATGSLAIGGYDAASPAKIVISGTPNQTVALLIGNNARFGHAARKVSVSSFTHSGGTSPALGPDGNATIELGATLRLARETRIGSYRGAFDVIVSNN